MAADSVRAMSRNRLSIAVVGGGFAGVGAAVMLRRAGYDGRHGVRARRARRRRLAPQHLSRRGVRRALAPLRVLVRAQPALVAALRAPGRDPGLPRGGRALATACSTASAPARRSAAPRWDSERARWLLETSAGPHEADILVTACGQLSVPSVPPLDGLDSFAGPAFHTARWRHDVDLAGKRVAVVGTGCSAIQVVPAIQPLVQSVTVYQRSPGWTFPKMDFAYGQLAQRLFERFGALQRLDRAAGVRLHGGRSGGDDRPRVAAEAVSRDRAPADHQGDRRPRAAREGHADRRGRLQARDAHRCLVSDADEAQRRARDRPDRARSRRPACRPPTAPSAPPT